MAATYSGKLNMGASATETLAAADVPAVSNPTLNHSGYDISETLNASSTVPLSNALYFEKALVAGVATIDLTALTDSVGNAVDGTTKKLRVFRVSAPTSNTGPITVTTGAANGYAPYGTAGKIVVSPGQANLHYLEGDASAISATVKDIDLSGTGAETLKVTIWLG